MGGSVKTKEGETDPDQNGNEKYLEKKKEKIQSLESKLGQIRKQALFLGDMSEMHCKSIKDKKLAVAEDERDKVFFQEQIIKERNKTVQIKQALKAASDKYDSMY